MLKNKFMYRIKCKGSNLSTFLFQLTSKGIKLRNIIRRDGLEFSLNNHDYMTFKTLDLSRYDIEVLDKGGWYYAKQLILSKIGVFLGFILSIALYIILSNKIFYISVNGNLNVESNDVLEYLSEMGISKFDNMPKDIENIENSLSSKFNFSLVSVITKGNTLIINVKEELQHLESVDIDLVAEYDMVIKSIEVFGGTALVKSGDIVKCGDVLVSGSMIVGDETVAVEPKAKITAIRYISSSYTFLNEETRVVRTGKKQVVSTDYYLGKYALWQVSEGCDFEFYEVEEFDTVVSQYFLPIRIKKVVAYEITDKIFEHDFESEKAEIIESLKNSCYESVVSENIESEECDIIPMSFGYVINYHLGVEHVFLI